MQCARGEGEGDEGGEETDSGAESRMRDGEYNELPILNEVDALNTKGLTGEWSQGGQTWP